jgi:hypothetical protein
MKKYLDANELAALFFLHYFKYTSYAFKKQKSEEDIASIHAHRELMRLFAAWYSTQMRVAIPTIIDTLKSRIDSPSNPFIATVSDVMRERIEFIYDNILLENKEKRLIDFVI